MWRITAEKRFRDCHRVPIPAAADVTVTRRGMGGRGAFTGLQNSHSVWASPVAAVGIARGRQREVMDAARAWLAGGEGRAVGMLTVTVRHRNGEGLADLLDGLSKAWAKVVSVRAYKGAGGIRERYGVAHNCWFLEITHGVNGWHPHRHMVLLLERALSPDELAALKAEVHGLWADKVAGVGLLAPNEAHGVDVQQVATDADGVAKVSTYAAKGMFAGLSAEVTGGAVKQARGGNRTPFQILEDVADALARGDDPSARDVALWREYEQATKGRKQRRWSTGALDALGIAPVDDDVLEHLEDVERGDVEDVEPVALVAIPRTAWRTLAHDVAARLEVLEAANSGTTTRAGLQAVCDVLERLGVNYRRVLVTHEQVEPVAPSARVSEMVREQARAVLV